MPKWGNLPETISSGYIEFLRDMVNFRRWNFTHNMYDKYLPIKF